MSDLNLFVVSGRLTRDAELKFTQSGQAVSNFSVASNRVWKKDNDRKEKTTFIDVVLWGKQAEVLQDMLQKGQWVQVTGRIDNDSWTTDDGQKRSRVTFVADTVDLPPRSTAPKNSSEQKAEEEVDFDTEETPF